MEILSNFNTQEIYFILYLVFINLVTFIAFGLDKSKAKNKEWRIPESFLIFLGLIGGGIGGLIAMVVFKHKLSKSLFRIGLPLIIIINKIIELVILNYLR